VAQAFKAETGAQCVLRVFLDRGLKAGDVLESGSFVAPFAKLGWTIEDLDAALEFAVEEDWLELVSAQAYRLTDTGFAEA
jgi:hypothetical protein